MSNRAMSWVWENAPRDIGPGELLLLIAIADQADDSGETYPSVEYLARKTRAHIDTVKRNMNGLISRGLVERVERRGRSNLYRVILDPPANYPPADCTPPQNTPGSSAGGLGPETPPQVATPPQNTPGSSAPPEPNPLSGHLSQQPHLPEVGGAGGALSDGADSQAEPARPKRSDRGHRLPDDWMPPRDAIDRMRAEYPGRDDEWWRRQFRRFTNHFRAEPGARGRKSDWTRTWENWIHKAVELEPARRGSTGRQSPGEAVAQGLDLVARLEAQEAAQLTDQPAITGGAG